MTTAKTDRSSSGPLHRVPARDDRGGWARRIELLEKGHHRLVFFGGLFGGLILLFVVALLIGVVIDGSPMTMSAAALDLG